MNTFTFHSVSVSISFCISQSHCTLWSIMLMKCSMCLDIIFLGAKETNRTGGRENEIAWTRYFFYRSSHWIVIFIARLYFVHFNSNCLASQLLFCWINPKRHICTRSPIFFQRICVYVIVNERKTLHHTNKTLCIQLKISDLCLATEWNECIRFVSSVSFHFLYFTGDT